MDRFASRFIRALLLPLLHLDRSGPLLLVRHFSCNEIKKATENFSKIIRSGSHGIIYKAHFSNGLVAAVREIRDFGREKDAFYREVLFLGCLHHRHLVALKGFSTGHNSFLIFDYMENGSLKEHLHDPLKTPLDWRTRLQIAADVAAALEYLQFFCDPPVYHVSINSSNILLDENFVAKISPVGFLGSDSYHMAQSSATCSRHTDQTCRCIIFQFGVLILELVTGQSLGNEGTDLVEWVQESIFSSSMHRLVDADLGDSYDTRELKSLLTIARMCTHGEGKQPLISIPQILRYLQRKIEPLVPTI